MDLTIEELAARFQIARTLVGDQQIRIAALETALSGEQREKAGLVERIAELEDFIARLGESNQQEDAA